MVERRVSTMDEEERVRGSFCTGTTTASVSLTVVVVVMTGTGDGEVGVSGRWSEGDSGEKEGNDVRDLSDAAMDEAELDGCEAMRALLLLARTVDDLWELLERIDCCEMERSSCSGDVDMELS